MYKVNWPLVLAKVLKYPVVVGVSVLAGVMLARGCAPDPEPAGSGDFGAVVAEHTHRSEDWPTEVVTIPVQVPRPPEKERRRLEREYGAPLPPVPGPASAPLRHDLGGTHTEGTPSEGSSPDAPALAAPAPFHGAFLGERSIPALPRGGYARGDIDETGAWVLRVRPRRFAWTGDGGVGGGVLQTHGADGVGWLGYGWAEPFEWRPGRMPPLKIRAEAGWSAPVGLDDGWYVRLTVDARLFGRR